MGKSKKQLKRSDWAEDRQPWDRQKEETAKAYEAFMCYCRLPYDSVAGVALGVQRTCTAVAKKLGKNNHQHVYKWKKRWGWDERVDAYDVEMQKAAHAERKAAHAAWVKQAERNLAQVRQHGWELYQRTFQRALEMLDSPLYIESEEVEEGEEGVEVVIRKVMPAGWNFNTVPRLIHQLIQLAQITTATGGDFDSIIKLLDYESLSDEQIEAIATADTPEEIIRVLIG